MSTWGRQAQRMRVWKSHGAGRFNCFGSSPYGQWLKIATVLGTSSIHWLKPRWRGHHPPPPQGPPRRSSPTFQWVRQGPGPCGAVTSRPKAPRSQTDRRQFSDGSEGAVFRCGWGDCRDPHGLGWVGRSQPRKRRNPTMLSVSVPWWFPLNLKSPFEAFF